MIDTLIIKTKKEVFGKGSGLFASRSQGEGYDFVELREYMYGEDARRIDWLASAKYQKPFVRVYQEERLRNIVAHFLLSGSLFFGTARLKIETLLEAFLLVGYSALWAGERLWGIADEPRVLPNLYMLERFAKDIAAQDLVGRKLHFDQGLLFHQIAEPSLILLFGDFLDPIDLSLLAQKHEVVAVVARDEIERGMDLSQSLQVVDTVTLRRRSLYATRKSFEGYGANVQRLLERNYAHFAKIGVDWVELYGSDNIYEKLYRFFQGR